MLYSVEIRFQRNRDVRTVRHQVETDQFDLLGEWVEREIITSRQEGDDYALAISQLSAPLAEPAVEIIHLS